MSERSLPLELARSLDRFREEHLGGEPDWKPLESALPAAWWGGFMWMSRAAQGETVIEAYKHGITRRYLNLDHQGCAWQYDSEAKTYRPQPLPVAIESVYRDIERLGAERSTVYNDAFIAARNRKLRDLGWEVVM